MTEQKTTRTGKSALWLVAGLFAASAVVRLSDGAAVAIAKEVSAFATDPHTSPLKQNICAPDPDVGNILAVLLEREAAVEQKERELETRARSLALSKAEIDKNLKGLEAAEVALRQTIATVETAAENDLDQLTSVYENMKPKDAADLFSKMAPDFAAGFLGRMRPDSAAAIMAGLDAEKAYALSVVLAGRNAKAPKD